jgi:hypothetical protein
VALANSKLAPNCNIRFSDDFAQRDLQQVGCQ